MSEGTEPYKSLVGPNGMLAILSALRKPGLK
jgi:hypothetical protein